MMMDQTKKKERKPETTSPNAGKVRRPTASRSKAVPEPFQSRSRVVPDELRCIDNNEPLGRLWNTLRGGWVGFFGGCRLVVGRWSFGLQRSFFSSKKRERERERERKLRLFFILLAFSSSTTPLPSYFYLCVIGWSDHFRFEVVRWFSTSVSFFLFCFLYCWFGKFRWKSVPSSAVDRDDVIAGSKRFQSRIDFLFFSFFQNVHFIIIIFKRKRAKTGAPPPLQIRKQEKKF